MTRAQVWRRIFCGCTAYTFGVAGGVGYTFRTSHFSWLELVDAAVMCAMVGWLSMWAFILIVAGPLHRRPSPQPEPVPAVVDDLMIVAHAVGVGR